MSEKKGIFSIGHSTHVIDFFASLLANRGVRALADVRTAPKSRRLPHFDGAALRESLAERDVEYVHLKELGGWRRPVPRSINSGWTVDGFQGYADYMGTDEFEQAIGGLEKLASKVATAYMCAEGEWRRCHRRLLSDALLVRGWNVRHILTDGSVEDHELTPFAVVDGTRIIYPPSQSQLEFGG